MDKKKILGQVFTEYKEVSYMVRDYSGDLVNSAILEPSFGDGQFLIYIVREIIELMLTQRKTKKQIAHTLNNNIWGYELDSHLYELAIANLIALVKEHDLQGVFFPNLKNETIFNIVPLSQKFNLIIGNPPYVRVQNFDEGLSKYKDFLPRTSGNTDLFLIFIDILLDKLYENGEFIFIVPNSLGKSKSASKIRSYMYNNGTIKYIDFQSRQLFHNASVYSCIFNFKYQKEYKGNSTFQLDYDGKRLPLHNSKQYLPYEETKIIKDYAVKNGIATLADRYYIFKKENVPDVEKDFLIPIYKGSRYIDELIAIFPYKLVNNEVVRFKNDEELKDVAPKLFNYFIECKENLIKRDMDKNANWFEYGRSQAIKDLFKEKWVIDTLIKPNQDKLTIRKIPGKTLVYSGLYALNSRIILDNDVELINSLRLKAKDMRGGYKKISSSLLK